MKAIVLYPSGNAYYVDVIHHFAVFLQGSFWTTYCFVVLYLKTT